MDKWGQFLPLIVNAAALHSYVVLEYHMHWALDGAQGWRELDKKKLLLAWYIADSI